MSVDDKYSMLARLRVGFEFPQEGRGSMKSSRIGLGPTIAEVLGAPGARSFERWVADDEVREIYYLSNVGIKQLIQGIWNVYAGFPEILNTVANHGAGASCFLSSIILPAGLSDTEFLDDAQIAKIASQLGWLLDSLEANILDRMNTENNPYIYTTRSVMRRLMQWKDCSLFELGLQFTGDLRNGRISMALRREFRSNHLFAPDSSFLLTEEADSRWSLVVKGNRMHRIKKEENKLSVYGGDLAFVPIGMWELRVAERSKSLWHELFCTAICWEDLTKIAKFACVRRSDIGSIPLYSELVKNARYNDISSKLYRLEHRDRRAHSNPGETSRR